MILMQSLDLYDLPVTSRRTDGGSGNNKRQVQVNFQLVMLV